MGMRQLAAGANDENMATVVRMMRAADKNMFHSARMGDRYVKVG